MNSPETARRTNTSAATRESLSGTDWCADGPPAGNAPPKGLCRDCWRSDWKEIRKQVAINILIYHNCSSGGETWKELRDSLTPIKSQFNNPPLSKKTECRSLIATKWLIINYQLNGYRNVLNPIFSSCSCSEIAGSIKHNRFCSNKTEKGHHLATASEGVPVPMMWVLFTQATHQMLNKRLSVSIILNTFLSLLWLTHN